MTTIQEVVLQIKDKNVKWGNTVEEVYFKKKKSLFFFGTYTYCPNACPNCDLLLKTVLVLLELRLIRFLDCLLFLN